MLGKNTAELGAKETEDKNMAEAKDKTFENCGRPDGDADGGNDENNIRRRVECEGGWWWW